MGGVEGREFEELFVAEFPAVVRSVFVVCQDLERAEDLAQEAFLELLRHWGRVSRYDRPGAWVRRVAIRKAVQVTKREARRSWFERRAVSGPFAGDSPALAIPDDRLWATVRTLAPQQRAVVALFYYEDMAVDEIAVVLGCSTATVKVHLHRARESLRGRITRTEWSS
jgi:RNA polymerase sigma factor (sigma-70 family)